MSKKIVVITGSPRKKGNSFAMTDAFIQAAQAKGHTVTRFDAAGKKLTGCHACETACKMEHDLSDETYAVLKKVAQKGD